MGFDYVPEEIKPEHLCAYPEVISACTQSSAEIGNDPRGSPLYLQANSTSEALGSAHTHGENATSGRVLKTQTWYLKLLDHVLGRKRVYGTLTFSLAFLFSILKHPEREVMSNLGSSKTKQNHIIVISHVTLHCNYQVTLLVLPPACDQHKKKNFTLVDLHVVFDIIFVHGWHAINIT